MAKFVVTRAGTTTPLTGLTRTAGIPLGIRVTARDIDGNIISGFNGTVSLTSNSWIGSVIVHLTNGVADNVSVTPKIAGTLRYISVTFGSSTTANASGNFTVVPGTVQKLQVLLPGETSDPGSASGKTGTPAPQVVGVAFNVIVNAVDAYWNRVTSINHNIDLDSTDLLATLPLGASLGSGTGTFSVTFNTAGSWRITASDTSSPSRG